MTLAIDSALTQQAPNTAPDLLISILAVTGEHKKGEELHSFEKTNGTALEAI